jgi:hypothetical protein
MPARGYGKMTERLSPTQVAPRGMGMSAGFVFLIVGVVLGAFLRLPVFMGVAVLVVATYGWNFRHHPLETVGCAMLVGLLAIQCGYALMIVASLMFKAGRRRLRSRRSGGGPG